MASNASAYIKVYQNTTKPVVDKVFDDLERFRAFCVEYGHNFNPAHLYRENNNVYKDFVKFSKGREPRNRWTEDAKKLNGENE
jgi:hypothetical protein